jgi:hypothetical protein
MNRARSTADSRYRILAYLLTAALLLSTGLNCYLLGGSSSPGGRAESADAEELAAVESELLKTRSQLARCRSSIVAADTLGSPREELSQRAVF